VLWGGKKTEKIQNRSLQNTGPAQAVLSLWAGDSTAKRCMILIFYWIKILFSERHCSSRAPVAHASNPSYSGGRDQEHHSSKPAQENSLQNPISKNPSQEKGWWSGSRCKPW
jgi:hypothetical protein